jgi:hypothetical protein
MSEAERLEFNRALAGGLFIDFDPEEYWTETDWNQVRRSGCRGWAQPIAFAASPVFWRLHDTQFDELWEERGRLFGIIERHSDAVAASDDWSACMADKGHPGLQYQTWGHSMREPLSEEMRRLSLRFCSINAAGLCPHEELNDEWHTSTERTDLLEREIQLALADFDCIVATELQVRMDAVRYEVETQFITSHRNSLEAYRSHVEHLLAQRDR